MGTRATIQLMQRHARSTSTLIQNQEKIIAELRNELRGVLGSSEGRDRRGGSAAPSSGARSDGCDGVSGDAEDDAASVSGGGIEGGREKTFPFLETADGAAIPIVSGGERVIDWEAVYADIDQTREAVDERRRKKEGSEGGKTSLGGRAASSKGKGSKGGVDWEAAYAEMDQMSAEKATAADAGDGASKGEGEEAAPVTPRAGTARRRGPDAETVPAADRGARKKKATSADRADWDDDWNPKPGGGASAELVGDLYKKLAALGAKSAGELLMQSPTVERQLSRMSWR